MKPAVIGGYRGMQAGDGVLMANFRADRARQILAALLDPDFDGFARDRIVRFAAALGMAEYSDELNPFLDVLFPSQGLTHALGSVIAEGGLRPHPIGRAEW